MNDLDKTLNHNELDSTDSKNNNVYNPFYTPSENIKSNDNQPVSPKGYFYIECYGCY
jgi:hypothetical protein